MKISKNKNSLQGKQKQQATNKQEKSLVKTLKVQRSSTTYLNQYSKKLLLNKNEDFKPSGLLKRHGMSLNSLIQSVGVTKRQSDDKFQQFQKVNQIIQNLKKRKSQAPSTGPFINNLLTIQPTPSQQPKLSRLIKTSNTNSRSSLHKKGLSQGKLCLGKNILAQHIPSRQQRLNPFYQQPRIITQNMINRKGIFNLVNTGLLPQGYDFLEILNNRYEPIEEEIKIVIPQPTIKIQEETFMTNPALMNQYEEHRKMSEAQLKNQQYNQKTQNSNKDGQPKKQNKIRKTKLKKVKKLNNKNDLNDKLSEIIPYQLPLLSIDQGKIEKTQQYRFYFKHCLKQGTQNDFLELVQKMQTFTIKHNIKKIKFKPNLLFVRRFDQKQLLSMIQNYKIFGYDRVLKTRQDKFQGILIRAIQMHRLKKMRFYLKKIENLKKYFRIQKLYHQNIDKRYNFFKYRLGSFAEQQRKFIQNYQEQSIYLSDFKPKVEIHILTKETTFNQENTYYKLRQRLRAHLMRIFNTDDKLTDIIFLTDPNVVGDIKTEMDMFVKMALKLAEKVSKVTQSLPNIHIFNTKLNESNVSVTGRTYFGITQEIISLIRNISRDQKPVIIPYQSSKYLPFICQTLNANLFGGTFTKNTINMIFQEDNTESEIKKISEANNLIKFKKLYQKHTFQAKIQKLKTFELANSIYQNRSNIYEIFFKKHNKLMPFRIAIRNKNQDEVFKELVTKIITHKESTKWILKMARGKFSRGIGIIETNDLKIFQEARKKPILSDEDIFQCSKLMDTILKDKIRLNHSNLAQKRQYLKNFFSNEDSYFEQFIQNAQKICVFGKILPDGRFYFMGSYKKFYTVNGVGFGACYPAQQITEELIEEISELSKSLYDENVFGYATFQFLYQERTDRFYYIDFTPNLEEYASLYFMYNSLFKSQNMYPEYPQFNTLPRQIFYCPFLDNNGNKIEDVDTFLDECRTKKIWYNSMSLEGQKFFFYNNDPTMLSLVTFSASEFQSIKLCIDAISFLVDLGGKFNQFDKKYIAGKQLKMDGLYMMDILWKLREVRKKMEIAQTISDQKRS